MYIAHIRETDGEIQTVGSHSFEVMKLAEKFSSGLKFSSIMQLAAVLHDSGKMNDDFNSYIKGETNFRRGDIDHSYAGAKYITELSQAFEGENVSETALFIARIIVSHHGLHDWVDEEFRDYLKVRTEKNDRYDEICAGIKTLADDEKLKNMLKAAAAEYTEIKNKLFALCGKNSVRFSFYMGMFERLAESVLVDADRTDTAEFMDGIKPQEFDTDLVWENMYAKIEGMCESFRKKTDHISRRRMDISDRCAEFAKSERGICRLAVPTGGGKTISSLRFAVNYCKKFGKKKIFYIAPFMSVLEQNSDVLRSVSGDEILLEYHSNIAAEIDSDEELNEYELRCERWENPVIATTAVQFLNTLFSGKMSSVRRFHNMANSVIIIDEIQSLPIKCVTTQLIEAGVDISFNCVIRSAAGAESIVQAAGRCNRNGDDEIRPVYVINVKEERLGSGLEQIKAGRDIFIALAGNHGDDLMSNEVMTLYFRKLYSEYKKGRNNKDELEYYAKNMDSSLLDLLSKNKIRSEMCKSDVKYRAQAFATAGKLFEVIDENTQDIIVPYNEEAEKIILDLNSDISAEEAVKLLRKAQRYSVGIYSSAFGGMLEKRQIHTLKYGGVFALDKSCFNEELGIENESVSYELLIY